MANLRGFRKIKAKNFTKLLEKNYVFMQNSSESHLRKSNFKVENRMKYAKTQQNSEISKPKRNSLLILSYFPCRLYLHSKLVFGQSLELLL